MERRRITYFEGNCSCNMLFDEQFERSREKRLLWGATIGTFVAVLLVSMFLYRNYEEQQKATVESVAHQNARRLLKNIDAMSSSMRALRILVDAQVGGDLSPALQTQLDQLRGLYPFISSFEVVNKGVVAMVSSRAEDPRPLGVDVFKDPLHRLDAQRAIERNDVTVTGPIPLFNGEVGIVLRSPVFDLRGQNKETPEFWGFVQASASIKELLEASDLRHQWVDKAKFELWKMDESTGERWMFHGSQDDPFDYTIDVPIEFLDGHWMMSLEDPTAQTRNIAWLLILLLPSLSALAVAHWVRESQRKHAAQVRIHERQLDRNRRLSSLIELYQDIFDAIDAGLVQWNKEQCLETWNSGFEKMYPRLVPHLEKGMTRKSIHRLREQFGETEVTQDWESTGTWYRQLEDGRIIMLKRTAMPDGGRLGMHMDMTHALGDQEYE